VAVVAVVTAVGLVLRLLVAGESLFADELSTYWIVASNGLGGVVSTVHTNAEISPPLYFVSSWLTTRIDLTPELLRAPSLLAGTATIPLVYALGARTVGKRAGLIATPLVALSPFMIYYSAEARSYALMMALVVLSTVALVQAVRGKGVGWWVGYAAFSAAAFYTHYTSSFALAAQFLWAIWAYPEARRPALAANVAAAAAILPWLTGLINDINSPTTGILSLLARFDIPTITSSLGHWSIGYPYDFVPLSDVPGMLGWVALSLGVAFAVTGAVPQLRRPHASARPLEHGLALIVVMTLAAPLAEFAVSVVSTNIFGTRDIAVSWPYFALTLGALVVAVRPVGLRAACVTLLVAGYAIGTVRTLSPENRRPDYIGAAHFIEDRIAGSDVVIDAAALTPGPVSGLDAAVDHRLPTVRAGAPDERDHPFTVFDRVLPVSKVTQRAAEMARGGRVFVLRFVTSSTLPGQPNQQTLEGQLLGDLRREGFREVESMDYPGSLPLRVDVFDPGAG